MPSAKFLVVSFALSLCCLTGLFAEESVKTVRVSVSADSEEPNFEAFRAMDGDPQTLWHTQFSAALPKPPHELTADLKGEYPIEGFVYTPRRDNPNGIIAKYEVFLGNDSQDSGKPVAVGTFPPSSEPSTVLFDSPVKGRYFKIRAISEINGNAWSSIGELKLLCKGVQFRGDPISPLEQLLDAFDHQLDSDDELVQQYAFLMQNLKNKAYFDKVAPETFQADSLILPGDRDPLDVVLRRTTAVLADLKAAAGAGDFSGKEKRLAALREKAAAVPTERFKDRFGLYLELCKLRREIVFANPLLDFNEILFVKKHRATYNHMCDQYYGINLLPGGGLYVLSNPFAKNGADPAVRDLLGDSSVQNGRLRGTRLDGGAFATPELSFDGKKIAFAYVECKGETAQRLHVDPARGHWHEGRSFHVFSVNADGSDLRQLTDGTWNDFDPCFLPNGRLAFISERRNGYLRCGRECPTFTLFDMNPDGTQMRCLSYHETNEWNPSVTKDGRILYTRWDYVDRGGCTSHQPWVTTLDGRDARAVHGNFAPRHARPDMELDCRAIPDSNRFVGTAAPHHGQAFGSLVLIDPQVEDDDAMGPIKRISPDVGFPESQGGTQVYGTPWPLSEKYYLAVADFAMPPGLGSEGGRYIRGDYGIYLVDAFGNKELLYRDASIGSVSPIPLVGRSIPAAPPQLLENEEIVHQPFVTPNRSGDQPEATVSVVDVYQSLRPWPQGTKIKELRVIQIIPMSVPSGAPPHETGFREPSSLDSVVLCRYVLGTVPVEEDGSAHFTVPAQKEILFQALDENGLAVQSMRSATYLKEGETLVCNGCHEPKHQAPPRTSVMPKAFVRNPSTIKSDVPEANPFSYPLLVQPILEKHCVDCHAQEIAKGTANVPNLAKEPIRNKWYASFNELVPKYGFYDFKEPLRTAPGKFGARASELYRLLQAGHYDVALSPEEMHKIALWLDCVSPFYGVYEKEGGEAQLRGEVVYPTLE